MLQNRGRPGLFPSGQGADVRRNPLVLLLFTLLPLLASSNQNTLKPIDCTQLMAWIAGGVSSPRLQYLLRERTLGFFSNEAAIKQLTLAGADPLLISSLRATKAIPKASASACPAKLAQAGELVREKHYDDAATTLDPLIASDPHNPALHFLMGYIRQQQENWDRAFDEYSTSRDELPGSSDTHSRLAYVFYRYDDATAASAAYRKAVALNPQFWEAYNNLGLLLHDSGKLDDAISAYREAKRLAPGEASVRNNLGNAFCDKGDYDSAIAELRELYRMIPGWERGHSCLAKPLLAKGESQPV